MASFYFHAKVREAYDLCHPGQNVGDIAVLDQPPSPFSPKRRLA